MEAVFIVAAALAVVLLTSLLKNTDWNPRWKNTLAVVLSVVGAGLMFVTGVDFGAVGALDVMQVITAVYGTSQLIYNFILNGTRAEAKLANTKLL